MTGAGTTQQSTPEDQTSSSPTAAPNTSNASNAPRSAAAVGAHTFLTDLTHDWWNHGGGTYVERSSMSGGDHSDATHSQDQDQNHTHAASSSGDDARNDTAVELPQSLGSTAQHLPDIEASTSRSMAAAGRDDGFVRPETSDSVIPDFIGTDASSLSQGQVNSPRPLSGTQHGDTTFDAAGSDDEDSDEGIVDQAMLGSFYNITAAERSEEVSDEAIVVQAMRGSFKSITRSSIPNGRKKSLLLRAVCEFRRHSEGHSDISAMVDGVSLSLRKTKKQNLRRKFQGYAKKLDEIREHVTQFTVPWEALATADGGRKRKTSSASDTEEHTQPPKKKSRPSAATPTEEKTAGESDPEEHERLSNTYANQIVILNNDLGNATDKVRYSMSFYKDALVVSTDGSYSFSPASGHAGAGMAWPASETDNEVSNPEGMKWYGISWPLGKASDGQPISTAYAERMAIRLALRMIKWKDMAAGRQSLVIQTDSQTCLHQIKDGLEGKSRDNDVNDIVLYVQALRSQFDVKLIWVKGHHQCTGNRIADRYAHGGRVSSELGSPAITTLDHSAPPGEVRMYAAGLMDRVWKKATCDAGTQTEPLMDEDQGTTTDIAHVPQESTELDTAKGNSSSGAGPNTTETSTGSVVCRPSEDSGENGNAGAAGPGSEPLDATQQSDHVNHTGTTFSLGRLHLAYAEPFMSDELRAALYERSGARISPVHEEGEAWNYSD